MLSNAVYLILGFLIGFLIAAIIRSGGRAELEAEILALERRNKDLRDRLKRAQIRLAEGEEQGPEYIGPDTRPEDREEKKERRKKPGADREKKSGPAAKEREK